MDEDNYQQTDDDHACRSTEWQNRSALFSDCLTTLSTNLCSSIYQIAVLIVLQRQPPRNLKIIIFIERGFTACSLAMLPASAPVDPACETFSARRKIKVVQRELSAAALSVLDQRVV